MKTTHSATPIIVGALAIASILGAALFVATQSQSQPAASSTNPTATTQAATKETTNQATNTATASTTPTSPSTSTTPATTSGYKDGNYSATASYTVPRGYENSITVTLTVKDGLVTAAKSTHTYTDHESAMYIDSFDGSIQSSVVGKTIRSLSSLSRVGGASLTTSGFDDAITTIATRAKA